MSERILSQRIKVSMPIDRDVMYVCMVRYVETIEDEKEANSVAYEREIRSYYGGVGGEWYEFQPNKTMDFNKPGVFWVDGLEMIQLETALNARRDIEDDYIDRLRMLYLSLGSFFEGEDDAGSAD